MSIINKLSQSEAEINELIVDKEKINENLFCGICSELLLNQKECCDCQHLVCTKCITEWSKSSNKCPFCRKSPMKFQEPHRFVKNMISNLKVQCPNIPSGCKVVVEVQSLNNHIKECQYQVISCEFAGCQEMLMRPLMKEHQENCDYRLVICQKCQCSYRFIDILQHDCIKQLKAIIQDQKQQIEQFMKLVEQNKKERIEEIQLLTNQLKQLELAQLYKCPQQHILSWSLGSFDKECIQCRRHDCIVRYKCNICQIQYCQICKPPKFLNGCCHQKHKLQYQQRADGDIICDFCNISPYEQNIGNWNDYVCDFDVCDKCYKAFQQ